jgi:hypothetical protein
MIVELVLRLRVTSKQFATIMDADAREPLILHLQDLFDVADSLLEHGPEGFRRRDSPYGVEQRASSRTSVSIADAG